jgi:hypothetical protein
MPGEQRGKARDCQAAGGKDRRNPEIIGLAQDCKPLRSWGRSSCHLDWGVAVNRLEITKHQAAEVTATDQIWQMGISTGQSFPSVTVPHVGEKSSPLSFYGALTGSLNFAVSRLRPVVRLRKTENS